MERYGKSVPLSRAVRDLGISRLDIARSVSRLKESGKFESGGRGGEKSPLPSKSLGISSFLGSVKPEKISSFIRKIGIGSVGRRIKELKLPTRESATPVLCILLASLLIAIPVSLFLIGELGLGGDDLSSEKSPYALSAPEEDVGPNFLDTLGVFLDQTTPISLGAGSEFGNGLEVQVDKHLIAGNPGPPVLKLENIRIFIDAYIEDIYRGKTTLELDNGPDTTLLKDGQTLGLCDLMNYWTGSYGPISGSGPSSVANQWWTIGGVGSFHFAEGELGADVDDVTDIDWITELILDNCVIDELGYPIGEGGKHGKSIIDRVSIYRLDVDIGDDLGMRVGGQRISLDEIELSMPDGLTLRHMGPDPGVNWGSDPPGVGGVRSFGPWKIESIDIPELNLTELKNFHLKTPKLDLDLGNLSVNLDTLSLKNIWTESMEIESFGMDKMNVSLEDMGLDSEMGLPVLGEGGQKVQMEGLDMGLGGLKLNGMSGATTIDSGHFDSFIIENVNDVRSELPLQVTETWDGEEDWFAGTSERTRGPNGTLRLDTITLPSALTGEESRTYWFEEGGVLQENPPSGEVEDLYADDVKGWPYNYAWLDGVYIVNGNTGEIEHTLVENKWIARLPGPGDYGPQSEYDVTHMEGEYSHIWTFPPEVDLDSNDNLRVDYRCSASLYGRTATNSPVYTFTTALPDDAHILEPVPWDVHAYLVGDEYEEGEITIVFVTVKTGMAGEADLYVNFGDENTSPTRIEGVELGSAYYEKGTHTSEWRDMGGKVSWKDLRAGAEIPSSTSATATIVVSNDRANWTDSKAIDLQDGFATYDISDLKPARYLRIITDMFTSDNLVTPRVMEYEVTASTERLGGRISSYLDNFILDISDFDFEEMTGMGWDSMSWSDFDVGIDDLDMISSPRWEKVSSRGDWENGTFENTAVFKSNLILEGSLSYEWCDTGMYYKREGHPSTQEEMNRFFDPSMHGVEFGGRGDYTNENIRWDSGTTWQVKPPYLPADTFSWKVEGTFFAPEDGTYTFATDSDDASDLIVDGQLVAHWYGGHAIANDWTTDEANRENGTITLERGYHTITARMEEGEGDDGFSVGWQRPTDSSIATLNFENRKTSGTHATNWENAGKMTWWNYLRSDSIIDSNEWAAAVLEVDDDADHTSIEDVTVRALGGGDERFDLLAKPVLRMDGNDYVQVPHDSSLNLDNMTISAWVNPEDVAGEQTIIYKDNEYRLFYRTDETFGNRVWFDIYDSTGTRQRDRTDDGEFPVPGKWTHVAVTYDGSQKKFYLNGELVESAPLSVTVYSDIYPVEIGDMVGSIEDVMVYNQTLDENQIKEIYKDKFISSNLVGYWPLDESQGDYAYDLSGNNNLGTLQGDPEWGDRDKASLKDSQYLRIRTWLRASEGGQSPSVNSYMITSAAGILRIDNFRMELPNVNVDDPDRIMTSWRELTADNASFRIEKLQADTRGIEYNMDDFDASWSGFKSAAERLGLGPSVSWIVDSESGWETGLMENVEADSPPGDLKLGYRDGEPGDESVGYWRFDRTEGPVLDSSGEGNDGTAENGVKRGRAGIWGSRAFDFDGSDDYVEIPDDPSLNFGTGDFSYSMWIKQDNRGASTQQILCKRMPGNGNYEVQIQPDGRIRVYFGDSTGSVWMESSTIVSLGQWYHVSVVRNGDNGKLYVNGTLENTISTTHDVSSGNDLGIGVDIASMSEFFDGKIDEVMVDNCALSSSEIQALYSKENGLWQSSVHDYGTKVSFNSFNISSKLNPALNFDGKEDYVKISHDSSLDVTSGLTISGWFYLDSDPDTTGGNDYRIMVGRGGGYLPYGMLMEENRQICVNVENTTGDRYGFWTGYYLSVDEWHHLAYTYESSTGVMNFYVDGNWFDNSTFTPDQINTSTNNLQFSDDASNPDRTWPGMMDGIRLYDRALSSSKIQDLYVSENVTDGLIGYWPLNEASGTVARDESGNYNDGLVHGPTWTSTSLNPDTELSALVEVSDDPNLKFDGSGDYVEIPDADVLDITDRITISGWLYLDRHPDETSANDWRGIIMKGGYDPYGVLLEEDNRGLSGSVFIKGSRQKLDSNYDPSNMVGRWTHFAYTYDAGTGEAKIYVDNQLMNSGTFDTGSIDIDQDPLIIGARNTDANPYEGFPGKIDDVLIYCRILNENEIGRLYENKSVPEGLVGSWTFQEGAGTKTARDTSKFSNHGTIHGARWDMIVKGLKSIPSGQIEGGSESFDIGNLPNSRYARVRFDLSSEDKRKSPIIRKFSTSVSTPILAKLDRLLLAGDRLHFHFWDDLFVESIHRDNLGIGPLSMDSLEMENLGYSSDRMNGTIINGGLVSEGMKIRSPLNILGFSIRFDNFDLNRESLDAFADIFSAQGIKLQGENVLDNLTAKNFDLDWENFRYHIENFAKETFGPGLWEVSSTEEWDAGEKENTQATRDSLRLDTKTKYASWNSDSDWERGAGENCYIRKGKVGIGFYDAFEREIYLSKGYHKFEVRMEEGWGDDGIAVGWQRPSDNSIDVMNSIRSASYEWYDTSSLFGSEGHPESELEFNEFFNEANPGVSFGGEGDWTRDNVYWHNTTWGPKPGICLPTIILGRSRVLFTLRNRELTSSR